MAVAEPGLAVVLEWAPRAEPLVPGAVAALGEGARTLARRLLALPDAELAGLQGVGGEGVLLILGKEDALPWSPGVIYLGREPDAPALLLPTTHAVSVPPALLQRALLSRFADPGPPLAVLPHTRQVLSARPARAIDRDLLREWLGEDA